MIPYNIRRGTVHAVPKVKEQRERETYENEKRNEKASWGGVALALSMAMVIGIFAGTGFEVKAAGGLYYEEFTPPESYKDLVAMCLEQMELTCGEEMQYQRQYNSKNWTDNVGVLVDYTVNGILTVREHTSGEVVKVTESVTDQSSYDVLKTKYSGKNWYILTRSGNQPTSGRFVEITEAEIDNLENLALDAPISQKKDVSSRKPSDKCYVFCIWNDEVRYYRKPKDTAWSGVFTKKISEAKDVLKEALNANEKVYIWVSDKPATSETALQGGNETYTPHTHSYSWVTVQDVNAEQDGIEEYRCSCGDVQERCVLPRYMAIVKGLYGAVKDAPQNGTATFDTGSAFTMTDYVIRKLAERTDVTTVITFTYQNRSYRMTIPAGTDYTELLSDEDYFYGYFYFTNAVGATIEAL